MPEPANFPILMPKLGLTMTEGLLSSWLVKPGDDVKPGDVLFVVETEKIANEIEAQAAGKIGAILVAEGETVPVGTLLATWTGSANDGIAVPDSVAAYVIAAGIESVPAAVPSYSGNGARVPATPLARRMARDAGIDLSTVQGSGPRGRIKAADVTAAQAEVPAVGAPAVGQAPQAAQSTRMPVSQNRRVVAQRLSLSKQTIPHFYVLAEADMTRLLTLRQELNAADGQPRISINHFIVAAAGRALSTMPEFRVLWDGDAMVRLDDTDVGIAVDAPSGLIVPVLRDAGARSIDNLVREAGELVDRARQGKLKAGDLEGGSLSVSNVGMFGASHLVPIINPGQTAILGVGALKPMFRPDGDGLPALRQEAGLVLAADHRAVDGVLAARFLDRIVHHLEHPLLLLRGG